MYSSVRDSGKREEFSTGARRDTAEGKGRYDLLPTYALQRLAQHFENGAKKYDDENWRKGIPLRRFLDSAIRHTLKYLEGHRDEDHAIAAVWNLMALVETEEMIRRGILPVTLNNLPSWTDRDPEMLDENQAAREAKLPEPDLEPAEPDYRYYRRLNTERVYRVSKGGEIMYLSPGTGGYWERSLTFSKQSEIDKAVADGVLAPLPRTRMRGPMTIVYRPTYDAIAGQWYAWVAPYNDEHLPRWKRELAWWPVTEAQVLEWYAQPLVNVPSTHRGRICL